MTPKNMNLKTERLLALLEIQHILNNPTLEDCEMAEEVRIMMLNRVYILETDAEDEEYIAEWAQS